MTLLDLGNESIRFSLETYCDSVVAYFDVCGFRTFFKDLNSQDKVYRLNKLFEHLNTSYLSTKFVQDIHSLGTPEFNIISDSIIITTEYEKFFKSEEELRNRSQTILQSALYNTATTLAHLYFCLLAEGFPIAGALSVGKIYKKSFAVLGEGLIQTVCLHEQDKKARVEGQKYSLPRIIIDKTKIEKACTKHNLNFSDLFWFKQDFDNEWVVDVYNIFGRSQSHNKKGIISLVEQINLHIKSNLELYPNNVSIREKWIYIQESMKKLLTWLES